MYLPHDQQRGRRRKAAQLQKATAFSLCSAAKRNVSRRSEVNWDLNDKGPLLTYTHVFKYQRVGLVIFVQIIRIGGQQLEKIGQGYDIH